MDLRKIANRIVAGVAGDVNHSKIASKIANTAKLLRIEIERDSDDRKVVVGYFNDQPTVGEAIKAFSEDHMDLDPGEVHGDSAYFWHMFQDIDGTIENPDFNPNALASPVDSQDEITGPEGGEWRQLLGPAD